MTFVLIALFFLLLALFLLMHEESKLADRESGKPTQGGPSPSSRSGSDNFSADHSHRPRLGLKKEDQE